jgi:hypothetical protein
MRLVWQWIAIERELPPNWSDARLVLTVRKHEADRAAALLGGVNPLRKADAIHLFVTRRGASGPHALRRALLRLDRQGISGKLELAGTKEVAGAAAEPPKTLAAQWEAAVASLPADWSDLHAQIVLRSSDHLERAALLAAPLNPTRPRGTLVLRFRVAHRFGYGVSAAMARRCLERLDQEGIRGELAVLRVLCDTDAVATQGPVWRVGGKAV